MYYNVFALNPTSIIYSCYQDEKYTWNPMWFIIESECKLKSDEINGVLKNEGKIISDSLSTKIGEKLLECLESSKIDDYISRHKSYLEKFEIAKSYQFDKKLIKEFGNFCINSGGFKIL